MSSQASLKTRNVSEFTENTDNVYESVTIMSKRARQISATLKDELSSKLAEFASTVDNLEEIFENREQIEISKFYERMPKPTNLATEEFLEGELTHRLKEESEEESTL